MSFVNIRLVTAVSAAAPPGKRAATSRSASEAIVAPRGLKTEDVRILFAAAAG